MKILNKLIYAFLLFFAFTYCVAQDSVKVATWNLCNFGKSKSDFEMTIIAKSIKDVDVFAIQEISGSYYGAQAVAKLVNMLNQSGSKWDYALSDPTEGKGRERYAFVWKTSKLKLVNKPWLEKTLESKIDREPFLARFQTKNGNKILLATVHAVPKNKEPWKECQYLYELDEMYLSDNLLVMGDFNLSERDKAFEKLKNRNCKPAITKTKTSIKMEVRNGNKFANEYDNIFVDLSHLNISRAGIIDFTTEFPNLKEARKISDHVPVFSSLIFK